MQIDDKLISYLEDLSCLALNDSEKSQLADDLQRMIDGVSRISEVNTDGECGMSSVAECILPFDKTNVFRDDEVFASFERELILRNAPVKNDEFFIAPKTVE